MIPAASSRNVDNSGYGFCCLQQGSLTPTNTISKIAKRNRYYILVFDFKLLGTTCDIIGDPKPLPDNETPLVERSTPTIPHEDHVDSHLNENIDDSRHVEEPPTSKQKQDHVNLTPGAISKIWTCKCTSNDLKPVLQVLEIDSRAHNIDNKQWYLVWLSDGSFKEYVAIAYEIVISNKLQQGSIIQLTKYDIFIYSGIWVRDCNLLCSKCDIIGYPKLYPRNETPLVDRTTPTIPAEDQNHANSHHVEKPPTSKQKQDHVGSVLNEDIDDSRHVEEPPTSKRKPSSSTQKCSSHSPTQNKKRKLLSIDDITSGFDLTVIRSKCGIIGNPKRLPDNGTPLVERTTPTIPDEDQIHAKSHHIEEPPTSKQKQDHVDSLLNEDIDDSHHLVEEPPTSIQNPSTSTQKCSSHSITQNNRDTIMGVNLTLGAITKIMTDKGSSTDLKPVVQVTNILSGRISTTNDKQCYRKIVLSDGSSSHFGCIVDDIFISNELHKGSVVQLTKFQFTKFSIYGNIRVLLVSDLNVIHSKSDIVVNPENFPRDDIPLVERSTPPIPDEDHVDVSHAQESVTSSQKCSETQSRERNHQSSNETPVLKRSKPTIIDHGHSVSDTNEDVDNSHPAEEPSEHDTLLHMEAY
ncbi:Replication protein A 70 kDa DNA-binding subunit [Artemisia annua]|uniref:Replication protein A 70 kDa DNA-binding subunit n=1 Tax=Artemisia annua TaxID=35608 RepID=A0A2U1QDN5_ARTAN|nr:Replication protein A 70 kDa DNA-binding subunit [Artemisia annua]